MAFLQNGCCLLSFAKFAKVENIKLIFHDKKEICVPRACWLFITLAKSQSSELHQKKKLGVD